VARIPYMDEEECWTKMGNLLEYAVDNEHREREREREQLHPLGLAVGGQYSAARPPCPQLVCNRGTDELRTTCAFRHSHIQQRNRARL